MQNPHGQKNPGISSGDSGNFVSEGVQTTASAYPVDPPPQKRPYSSYTSKEIITHLPNERLEEALREIDSAIYGGILSTQMPFSMNVLLDKSIELYKKQRTALAESL